MFAAAINARADQCQLAILRDLLQHDLEPAEPAVLADEMRIETDTGASLFRITKSLADGFERLGGRVNDAAAVPHELVALVAKHLVECGIGPGEDAIDGFPVADALPFEKKFLLLEQTADLAIAVEIVGNAAKQNQEMFGGVGADYVEQVRLSRRWCVGFDSL